MIEISIIIAVRNNRAQLRSLLENIFSQTLDSKHYEVLVVDACSTDGTRDVVEEYAARLAWWVSEPDSGVYDAWNKALLHTAGEWVVFLGSDDFFPSEKLLASITPFLDMAKARGILYVYGLASLYSWEKLKSVGVYNPDPAELAASLSSGRFILHSGSFHHRALFDKYGFFDVSYRIAGDYALLLKYLKNTRPIFIPFPVVSMGIDGMSMGRSLRFNWYSFRENIRAYKESFDDFPWRIYARFVFKLMRSIPLFR